MNFLNILQKSDSIHKDQETLEQDNTVINSNIHNLAQDKIESSSSIDDFLLRIQLITVVSGNYIIFRFYFTRQQSFAIFKIRVKTFKRVFEMFKKTYDKLNKE